MLTSFRKFYNLKGNAYRFIIKRPKLRHIKIQLFHCFNLKIVKVRTCRYTPNYNACGRYSNTFN